MLRRANSAKRLRPNPEISVATIEGAIEEWLSQQSTRDLTHLISDLSAVTWKSSPKSGYLAKFASLYKILAKFAANGLLPTKKTSLALVAVHGKKPINFTAKNCSDWADEMGATIRCTFGKYRELAFGRNHAEQYRITMGNASEGDRKLIDEATLMVHKPLQHIAAHITQHPKAFQVQSPMNKHDQTPICIMKSTVQHHTKHRSHLLINTATHEHT